MCTRRILFAILMGLGIPATNAAELVKVDGSNTRFATTVEGMIGGKPVRCILTGAALRTKYFLSVYSIASYVQEGVKIRDAESLARVNAVKRLHLVFERAVDGKSMAKSFRESIGMNHPEPAFANELAKLERYFVAHPVRQGDHVWLTYVPGAGLGCQVSNHPGLVIANLDFAQAIWDVYLGPRNLSTALRSGLTSRL